MGQLMNGHTPRRYWTINVIVFINWDSKDTNSITILVNKCYNRPDAVFKYMTVFRSKGI